MTGVTRPNTGDGASICFTPLDKVAAPAFKSAHQTLVDLLPVVVDARPYAPEVIGGLVNGFGGTTSGYYDANGHYARASSADANVFHYCANGSDPLCTPTYALNQLAPIPPAAQFDPFTPFTTFTRCPGGATQPIPGSNPFLDGLTGECDPSDVPPGP